MHPNFKNKTTAIIASSLVAVVALVTACKSSTRVVEPPFVDPDAASLPAIVWGPAPAVFPAGAQMAVVSGDPSRAGEPFIVRLRFPNNYKIAPHTHPTDENLTVISGTFKVGMGTTFDATKMATLPSGAFATAPALHEHYAQAEGVTVVQVNAIGPFAMTYVNPSDLPHVSKNP